MTTFQKATDYLQSCSSRTAKIAAIDSIIDALLISAASAAESGHIKEYWLNDGQVQIRCNYNGPKEVMASIQAFRALRNELVQEGTGRVTRLMDHANFNGKSRSF